jgi:hypothetical protein
VKKSDFFDTDSDLKIRFFEKIGFFFDTDSDLKIRFFEKIGFF